MGIGADESASRVEAVGVYRWWLIVVRIAES